jgi:hypothetical protein
LCAREICKELDRDLAEEALLGTMLRRLGHILVAYYLPDEEQEILRLHEVEGLLADKAQMQVLGTDYVHIGREVAREWNFPAEIRQCMDTPSELPQKPVRDRDRRLQLVASLADQATTVLRGGRSSGSLDRMKELVGGYAQALGVEALAMVDSMGSAKQEYMDFRTSFANDKHKRNFVESLDTDTAEAGGSTETLSQTLSSPTLTLNVSDTGLIHTRVDGLLEREQMLSEGLQEVTRMMVGPYERRQLVDLVLEILYRGMGFKRIIAAVWHKRSKDLVPVSGVGEDVDELLKHFRLDAVGRSNLLSVALTQNSDVYIKDATRSALHAKMPSWFELIQAPGSFFVLPMRSHAGPVGMLYAEYGLAYGFDENPSLLHLAQALRNQLILGLEQTAQAAATR